MNHCDFCDRVIPHGHMKVHVEHRPSCPEELVATLGVCNECGPDLPTAAEVRAEVMETGHYAGRRTLFVTIPPG